MVILFQIQILFPYECINCVVIFLVIITFSPNYSRMYSHVVIILTKFIKMIMIKNYIWLHDYVWTLVAKCHSHKNHILVLWIIPSSFQISNFIIKTIAPTAWPTLTPRSFCVRVNFFSSIPLWFANTFCMVLGR